MNWCNHCGNQYELEAELPYDTENPLLGKMKTLIWKDTRISMFITALSTIAKTLKQLQIIGLIGYAIHTYIYIYIWIYIYTHTYIMEYYSAIKNNEILLFAATWMDLENIIHGQVRESQIPYDVHYIWNLKVVQMDIYTKHNQTHRHSKQT